VGAITAFVMDENVLRGAAVGAMTGAMADLTVLTGGTALAVAGGLALSGAAGYAANQAIDNLPVDPFDLAVSALMGAVGARNLPQGGITVGRLVPTNATLANNASQGARIYSEATYESFQRQLQQHGKSSVLRSRSTIQTRLNQHLTKLSEIEKDGGYTSSVLREIETFKSQLQAIDDLLK
jgi:hypothetical protein